MLAALAAKVAVLAKTLAPNSPTVSPEGPYPFRLTSVVS